MKVVPATARDECADGEAEGDDGATPGVEGAVEGQAEPAMRAPEGGTGRAQPIPIHLCILQSVGNQPVRPEL